MGIGRPRPAPPHLPRSSLPRLPHCDYGTLAAVSVAHCALIPGVMWVFWSLLGCVLCFAHFSSSQCIWEQLDKEEFSALPQMIQVKANNGGNGNLTVTIGDQTNQMTNEILNDFSFYTLSMTCQNSIACGYNLTKDGYSSSVRPSIVVEEKYTFILQGQNIEWSYNCTTQNNTKTTTITTTTPPPTTTTPTPTTTTPTPTTTTTAPTTTMPSPTTTTTTPATTMPTLTTTYAADQDAARTRKKASQSTHKMVIIIVITILFVFLVIATPIALLLHRRSQGSADLHRAEQNHGSVLTRAQSFLQSRVRSAVVSTDHSRDMKDGAPAYNHSRDMEDGAPTYNHSRDKEDGAPAYNQTPV